MAIIPLTDDRVVIIDCPVCEGMFYQQPFPFSVGICDVGHTNGSCCHCHETALPEELKAPMRQLISPAVLSV